MLEEKQNEPKHKIWNCALGGNETSGFCEGLMVKHEFPENMTYNQARTYLKTNKIMNEDGRIYHVMSPSEAK